MKENNEPLIVTKFEKKRLIPYLIFVFFGIFLFGTGVLFYHQKPNESYLHYLFIKSSSVFFFLGSIYLFMEPLNTKEFRVYENRIEKIARVFRRIPLIGNKVVYYDNAYCSHVWVGVELCNCSKFLKFLIAFKGILFFIKLLPREDQEKVADILNKVSGREKELFLKWGVLIRPYKFRRRYD
ncbi:hypothetical protein CLV27_0383 [Phorcysia thermohydrogeniphila]|uniref:Uncharacterized protein n=1 Tax=Phorcysia thermohydrogeniphila TaxID=936138 RepID=A0A4R1GHN2_9BACT|nr:hypothetical protein CLV27_0383 [Phorcysia thermohydrogeniphila]